MRNDLGGIQAKLRESIYTGDAIIPASPWIKAAKLRSPKVTIRRDGEFVRASWPVMKGAFWYVVYAKDKTGWTYSVHPAGQTSIALSADRGIDNLMVVTVDRLGNVSKL